jgi:osmoprotectant transport system substrate-binding protein
MRLNRTLALGASLLVLLGACSTGGGSTPSPSAAAASAPASAPAESPAGASASAAAALTPADIKIGSDDFYESTVVAEMWAQVLEKNGFKVDRHFNIGARQVRQPALEGGQIDLVPEYVGSGLNYYKGTATGDGEANRTALQAIISGKGGGLTLFSISPGQDQNAFVVRADTATADSLSKISDLLAKQASYTWGLPADCDTNPSCSGALKDGYGFTYPPAKRKALDACSAPMAQALNLKAIDIAELCSTQPAIGQFGFKLLDDDKKTQGAENIAAEVRNDYLAKVGDAAAFQALIDGVSAKLTTEELTKIGVEIQVNHKDVAAEATDWLKANGFL